ncbi:MAG: glycosyltransferase [Desulfobacula sp.]|nr:glycosyltransferase [Desulfobacula sp.]
MRILFVSSGNTAFGISPIVKQQGESLVDLGNTIDYFEIKGRGLTGYVKRIIPLRNQLQSNKYEIIHAHFSFSAFISSIARAKPIIVSLMGSDVKSGYFFLLIMRLFKFVFSWKAIIVKSEDMRSNLRLKNIEVIPNGVDLKHFKPMNKLICQKEVEWDTKHIHILFAANPNRPEKNFMLCKEAIEILDDKLVELHFLGNISHDKVPLYLNAANVVILTSLWEGSPNVIKEAMACGRPIVCTDVGDVTWLFGNFEGHYLATYNAKELSKQILNALSYSYNYKNTQGRQRIIELGIDSKSIANRLSDVYKSVLTPN